MTAEDKAVRDGLDKGMEKGDMESVYRGLGHTGQEKFLEAGVGGVVKDDAFVSTSRDTRVAKSFSQSGEGWRANIIVSPDVGRTDVNKSLGSKSQYSDEKEVLLARGTSYRIMGINSDTREISLAAVPS